MRYHRVILFLVLLIMSWPAFALVPQPNNEAPQATELQTSIRQVFESGGFAAIAVVLARDGDDPSFLEFSSPQEGPVGPDRRFRIGSVTQALMGLGLLRLSEQGKPGVETRLSLLQPEIEFDNAWESSSPLRIEHLLEHTSGFQDFPLSEYTRVERKSRSIEETVRRNLPFLVSHYPPGSFSLPVSTGPLLAALAVERITKQPYERWLDEQVLNPLGMDAGFPDSEVSDGAADLWPILGLEASAQDLSVLLQLLLNRGRFEGAEWLTEASILRAETPLTGDARRHGLQVGPGLGLRTFLDQGFVFLGASGSAGFDRAALRYLPQHGVGYAVLSRGGNETAFRNLTGVLNAECTADLEPSQPLFVDVPANRLAATGGYYRPLTFRWSWTRFLSRIVDVQYIQFSGGKLLVEGPRGRQVQLFPVTDRRFRAEGEPLPTVVFSRGPDGSTVVQAFSEHFEGNHVRAVGGLIWLERILAGALLVIAIAWLVLAIGFSLRTRMLRGVNLGDRLHVLFPSLAALSLFGLILSLRGAGEDLTARFGQLTVWSGGFFASGLLLACSTLLGLGVVLMRWKRTENRPFRLVSLLILLGSAVVSAYLAYWGVLGFRTWV